MNPRSLPARFSPIELSEPTLEHENLRYMTIYSPALQGRGDVSLFVPAGIESLHRTPVVLLLPGVYGSHWCWFLKGAVHRTALRLIRESRIRPMLIASPSDGMRGDGTGYLPAHDQNFEQWICEDMLQCIEAMFSSAGADFLLAGLSMGGYGALRIGAKYPARFVGISAHSAITVADQFRSFVRDLGLFQRLGGQEVDPLCWLDRNRTQLPPIRFDCGRQDALLAGNEALHRSLTRRGIPHSFDVFPGGHDWSYWRKHVEDTLLFLEKILSGRKGP